MYALAICVCAEDAFVLCMCIREKEREREYTSFAHAGHYGHALRKLVTFSSKVVHLIDFFTLFESV